MNPATPGPLTVLLVSDDPALLADECGGRVPQVEGFACNDEAHGFWWAFDRHGDPPICDVCSARKRWEAGRALLLVLDGVPVAMGCDRAARWSGRLMSDRLTPEEAMQIARWCRSQRGARVVLLRDGREVTE